MTQTKSPRYMDFISSPRRAVDPLVERPVPRRAVISHPAPTQKLRRPAQPTVVKPVTKVTKTTTVTTVTATPVTPAEPICQPEAPKAPTLSDDELLEKEFLEATADIDEEIKSPEEEFGVINDHYSVGGKSPFINTDSVEKRPLSNSIPEYHIRTTKNVYTKERILKEQPAPAPVTIISTPPKKSHLSLIIIIILTVILGAAVGTIAYLLMPH